MLEDVIVDETVALVQLGDCVDGRLRTGRRQLSSQNRAHHSHVLDFFFIFIGFRAFYVYL